MKKVFGSHVYSGSVTAKHLEDIQSTVELLKTQRITASKGLLDYLHAADSIVRVDTTRWNDWHLVIHSMASDKKLRKRLQPFLANSKDLMLHDIVGRGPRHTWQLNGKPWYFETMDSRNLVRFDSCNLVLGFKGDTMRFEGVAGQWDLSDTEGEISASRFPWLGTVHDAQSTFATLPPTALDFSKDDFRLDSVFFIPLFPNSRLGKLTGKLEPGTKPVKNVSYGALQPIDCCFGQPARMLALSRRDGHPGLLAPWNWRSGRTGNRGAGSGRFHIHEVFVTRSFVQ